MDGFRSARFTEDAHPPSIRPRQLRLFLRLHRLPALLHARTAPASIGMSIQPVWIRPVPPILSTTPAPSVALCTIEPSRLARSCPHRSVWNGLRLVCLRTTPLMRRLSLHWYASSSLFRSGRLHSALWADQGRGVRLFRLSGSRFPRTAGRLAERALIGGSNSTVWSSRRGLLFSF